MSRKEGKEMKKRKEEKKRNERKEEGKKEDSFLSNLTVYSKYIVCIFEIHRIGHYIHSKEWIIVSLESVVYLLEFFLEILSHY